MQGLEGSHKVFDLDPKCSEKLLPILKQICIVKGLFWLLLGEGDVTRPGW